jgi:hypothetical protein
MSSRTTSNIHRVLTLAAVTVATAITLSTTAKADDDDVSRDAREVQRDREDTVRDTKRLERDIQEGRSIDRDLDRLQEDRQNTRDDRRRLERDVDRQGNPGDPGDDPNAISKHQVGKHPTGKVEKHSTGKVEKHQKGER